MQSLRDRGSLYLIAATFGWGALAVSGRVHQKTDGPCKEGKRRDPNTRITYTGVSWAEGSRQGMDGAWSRSQWELLLF